MPLDGNAEEARAALVLADGQQRAAEGRAQQKPINATATAKKNSTK